jgi:hypothetical protein
MNPEDEDIIALDCAEQDLRNANYRVSLDASKRFSSDDWPADIVAQSSALSRQTGGSQYKNMVIQPMEYCQKNKLGTAESFVVKYVSRHRSKNGAEDIKKAIHCLQLLLEIEYNESE